MAARKSERQAELQRLRAEAARKQRNAARKIARIRRNTGAILSATPSDPRVNAAKIARFTVKQLQSHISKLDDFTSRSTQYVGLSDGQPAPRGKWKELDNLIKQQNAVAAARDAAFGDAVVPGSGLTIKQRNEKMFDREASAKGAAANKPFYHMERKPEHIASLEALDKLIVSMKKKLDRDFLPEKIAAGRRNLEDMLKSMGNTELLARAAKLTDNQFDIFWNETMGATDASLIYEVLKKQAAGEKDRSHQRIMRDNINELSQLFDWAENLPAERQEGR